MKKVKFIVIGSMKSGTTSLVDMLKYHPEVFLPRWKEPQFFSRLKKYTKGEQWYESLFNDADGQQICGEGSTCYTRWPVFDHVPERIHAYSPQMLLIYIVRDPADRAYSHYRHGILKNEFSVTSFQEALENNPEILSTSMYMAQISQYLNFFPREQMFFMRFEDLNDGQVIRELFRFLSLKDIDCEIGRDTLSNKAGYVVVRGRSTNYLRRIGKLSGLTWLLRQCMSEKRRAKLRDFLAEYFTNSILGERLIRETVGSIDRMSDQERQYIYKYCAEDIRTFQEFTGLEISHWYEKGDISEAFSMPSKP